MQKDLLTHIMQLSSRWPKRPFSRDFYSAVASVLALMGFCFCAMADASNVIRYAPDPPYDNIPITPKTWEEVDLIYYSTISGHRYTNAIQLLRPIAWLHKRHMDIIGSKVTLSIPEFGIVNVLATVKGIKPTQIDTRGVDWSKQNSAPVIGKFMRYLTDVHTYTFKDSLGHISHINATPNHPFYVKNKHGFVAIGNVSDKDTLVGDIRSVDNHIDSAVHLVCTKGKHSHCGAAFGENRLPIPVYNFEAYRRHVYMVGSGAVLVHNGCVLGKNIASNDIEKRLNTAQWKIEFEKYQNYTRVKHTELATGFYKPSKFRNSYNMDHWIMESNYKYRKTPYYMSDVVSDQVRKVFGDDIELPTKITRYDIGNEETLSVIRQYTDHDALLNKFMTETVNGRSTQRILDMWGGKASKISIEKENGIISAHLIVHWPSMSYV